MDTFWDKLEEDNVDDPREQVFQYLVQNKNLTKFIQIVEKMEFQKAKKVKKQKE